MLTRLYIVFYHSTAGLVEVLCIGILQSLTVWSIEVPPQAGFGAGEP
jgi:hypothetical protein